MPGMTSSGCSWYCARLSGFFEQPSARPAPATPASFRKSLRFSPVVMMPLTVTGVAVDAGRRLLVLEVGLVTGHAPAHFQRRILVHAVHRLDRAVAGLALHAGLHVPLVVEKRMLGQVVHPHPGDRL